MDRACRHAQVRWLGGRPIFRTFWRPLNPLIPQRSVSGTSRHHNDGSARICFPRSDSSLGAVAPLTVAASLLAATVPTRRHLISRHVAFAGTRDQASLRSLCRSSSFAPSGLFGLSPFSYPRLAPWDLFFRRFAARIACRLHFIKRNVARTQTPWGRHSFLVPLPGVEEGCCRSSAVG